MPGGFLILLEILGVGLAVHRGMAIWSVMEVGNLRERQGSFLALQKSTSSIEKIELLHQHNAAMIYTTRRRQNLFMFGHGDYSSKMVHSCTIIMHGMGDKRLSGLKFGGMGIAYQD